MAMTVGTPILGSYLTPANTSTGVTITSPSASDFYVAVLILSSTTSVAPSISGVTGMTWTNIGDVVAGTGRCVVWTGTGGTATGTATASWGAQNRNAQLRIIPVTGITALTVNVATAATGSGSLAVSASLDGPSQTPAVGDLVVSWGRNSSNSDLVAYTFTPSGWTDHGHTTSTDTMVSAHKVAASTAAHKTTATNNHASARSLIIAQVVLTPTLAGAPHGAGTGSFAWAGSAAGHTTKHGSRTGVFTWVGAAAGHTVKHGVGTGAFAWAGAGVGHAPLVGEQHGSGSGAFGWAGSAVGSSDREGSGSGSFGWVGTAAGSTSTSGVGAGSFAWVGAAEGSSSTSPEGSASGTFGWAGVAVGDNGELEIPTDDETSGVDDEPDDDLEFTPPLALPPASLTEQPMWRRSVIVPDLSAYPKDPTTGQPIVSDAEYDSFDVVEEEVGVPHVIFPDNDDPNDMTYYRGLPIQGLRFLRREPFGDADADATIPGITSMDTHPDDVGAPTPFTRARANMEFILRKSDGSSRRMWSGNVFTRSLGNDGRQPTMNLHALGSLYMADSTRNRPVVSDDPLDYGYLIPRAFNLVGSRRFRSIAHIATGILTRERGAWSDSPMGFALDGLAKCWTLGGNQWTIAKVVGSRRQYEMRLKKTAPEWTFTNGARGVYVDLEEDDNGRNVVFGHGVNADGGIWFNTMYPDNGGVVRRPLAADPRTQRYDYDDDGNITGVNPEYDGNVLPREDDVDFGQNSKTIGIRSAQQIVDRESVPSFVGRITVETDPREGWRGDIQAGDKLTLIGYQGRDLVLHVSDVEVSLDGSVPVTLTVDERSRDAMTVAQIRDRNKEARRDPALRPGNPNRRSRLEQDQIVPFDAESKAGRIPATSVQGGQWNVITVPFATAGRIAKVHFETGSPMAAGLFAFRPSVAHLNSLIGNPLTQDDPLKAHMNTLEGTFGLCAFWGQQGQRMGYSPGREDAGDPFTGDFDEATGFDYVAQANARLYLAVYTVADTTVSGRCFPALVV